MMLSSTTIYVLAALLAAAGLAFIYLLRRTSPSRRIEGGTAWIGLILSGAVVLFSIVLVAVTYLQQAGYDVGGSGSVVGREAPELAFRLVETDEPRQLSAFRGQVVVLNLWATWCAPCLAEMPELNRVQDVMAPRGVAVVTISDEPREVLQAFEAEVPLRTVSGYLPAEATWPAPYDRVLTARPTSFIIDRQGIIRSSWPGASDFESFVAAVTPHL